MRDFPLCVIIIGVVLQFYIYIYLLERFEEGFVDVQTLINNNNLILTFFAFDELLFSIVFRLL
jgi:hypothetical protein